MKKLEENCIFLFFGKFLHHWKQKWWNMIKKWKKKWKKMKKMKKNEKTMKKKMKKNEKKWKKTEENCNFPRVFFSFFFIFFSFFYHFFIIFHHFSSFFINSTTGSKNDKKMINKMIKNEKKTRGKLQFFIFRKIFAPLEAKMMKNDQKMKKMKKQWKKMKKPEENCNFSFFGKLQFSSFFFSIFFHFFIIFHHFSSIPPLEAKMIKTW